MHPGVWINVALCHRDARGAKGLPNTNHTKTSPSAGRTSAIAIRRGDDPDARPQILAKGQGAIAEQILEIAFASGVKVRSDADLIEVLEAIEIDCEIPIVALATVAEILSYLYRANAGLMQSDQSHEPPSAPDDSSIANEAPQ